jgi:hypothetical protein
MRHPRFHHQPFPVRTYWISSKPHLTGHTPDSCPVRPCHRWHSIFPSSPRTTQPQHRLYSELFDCFWERWSVFPNRRSTRSPRLHGPTRPIPYLQQVGLGPGTHCASRARCLSEAFRIAMYTFTACYSATMKMAALPQLQFCRRNGCTCPRRSGARRGLFACGREDRAGR